jgi:hypothetical protein
MVKVYSGIGINVQLITYKFEMYTVKQPVIFSKNYGDLARYGASTLYKYIAHFI